MIAIFLMLHLMRHERDMGLTDDAGKGSREDGTRYAAPKGMPALAILLLLLASPSACARRAGDAVDAGPPITAESAHPPKHNEYLLAVRREQVELRARVTSEIDRLAKQLEGGPGRKDVRERRDRLVDDLELLDRSDERGWDELKGDIENDLAP
jgi:hypothetical protein